MTVPATLVQELRARVGECTIEHLGILDATTIRRYARAVGETDGMHYESHRARELGYADIVAPLNLLTAMVYWNDGDPTEALNADGTAPSGRLGKMPDGVRIMGGGERLLFHRPVTAGMVLQRTSEFKGVEVKSGARGEVCVVTFLDTYAEIDGHDLLTAEKTILLR